MKTIAGLAMVAILFTACEKGEEISEFTGNEITYALQPASQFPVSGTITFKERKDGMLSASIQLDGTEGDLKHPVHLHLGAIGTPDAEVALLLTPVIGKTGRSETTFNKLADESDITYKRLSELAACIKIHLGDTGPDRDVILAAGNIGVSSSDNSGARRGGVAACKSE